MAKAKRKSATQKNDEAVEILEKIEKVERELEKCDVDIATKIEIVKNAKATRRTLSQEMRELARTRDKWAAEAKWQPLLNQADNADNTTVPYPTTPTESSADDETVPLKTPSPNAWKRWPVSCLGECGLPPGKVKLLEEAGLETMGKLMTRMSKAGSEDFWWKDIRGFGESGYDALVDAIMALRKKKPEFQADAA
jgi:hypothetical protein